MSRITLLILFPVIFMPTVLQAQQANDLSKYRWENRLLLLIAPSTEARGVQDLQDQIAADQNAFEERDLLLISVISSGQRPTRATAIPIASQSALRKRYGVTTNEQLAILIGKDGGEKWRRSLPINLSEVYALIDTMPMRRQEMRTKKNE